MLLSITVWVKESDVSDLASVYFSVNKNETIRSLTPNMITNRKDLLSDETYVELIIPYEMYIELLNVNKAKELVGESDINITMTAIFNALSDAKEYGLQTEVVWSALKSMKENPNLTIEEAITNGFSEWIK